MYILTAIHCITRSSVCRFLGPKPSIRNVQFGFIWWFLCASWYSSRTDNKCLECVFEIDSEPNQLIDWIEGLNQANVVYMCAWMWKRWNEITSQTKSNSLHYGYAFIFTAFNIANTITITLSAKLSRFLLGVRSILIDFSILYSSRQFIVPYWSCYNWLRQNADVFVRKKKIANILLHNRFTFSCRLIMRICVCISNDFYENQQDEDKQIEEKTNALLFSLLRRFEK